MSIEQEKNKTYSVRCSTFEEKTFLHNAVQKSGLSPATFIKSAVEAFLIQNNEEEKEVKKAFAEVDNIINRLSQLTKSEFIKAFEMQRQAKKELQELDVQTNELEASKINLEADLKDEFEKKIKEIDEKYKVLIHQKEEGYEKELEAKDKELLSLREEFEGQEAKYRKLLNDYTALSKQFDDKNKLNIAYEERNDEANKRIMELEEKISKSASEAEKVRKLEVECAILKEKIESIRREEGIKRDYLELSLKNLHVNQNPMISADNSIINSSKIKDKESSLSDAEKLIQKEKHPTLFKEKNI
jgi:chromosome segregation ATPase